MKLTVTLLIALVVILAGLTWDSKDDVSWENAQAWEKAAKEWEAVARACMATPDGFETPLDPAAIWGVSNQVMTTSPEDCIGITPPAEPGSYTCSFGKWVKKESSRWNPMIPGDILVGETAPPAWGKEKR